MTVGGSVVSSPDTEQAAWYADWQHPSHAPAFDWRAPFDDRNVIRSYECFNDVRLLRERVGRSRPLRLVEVGCATGGFSRYLRLRFPNITYCGMDVSAAAIDLARSQYRGTRFIVNRPDLPLEQALAAGGIAGQPEIVYAKDVVHHQTNPFAFLAELLGSASEAVILRLRTRDVGATELNPEESCQYHYGGWMPYIVMNLEEVLEMIRQHVPDAEAVVYRHHMILGGRLNRYLPKACYLSGTGTAETAIGVFRRAPRSGTVRIEDRADGEPAYTMDFWVRRAVRKALERLRS